MQTIKKPTLNISIITPCFNRSEFITEAIRSVLDQNYPCFEHIIIDGGSNDGTLQILSKYPHLKIISEPDKGVYDALNKGINQAKGDIIGFLNTDDFYAQGVFNLITSKLHQKPKIKVLIGGAKVFTDNNTDRIIVAEYPTGTTKELPYKLTIGIPAINAWFFQANIIKNKLWFDLSYKIAADRHFLLNLIKDISLSEIDLIENTVYYYRQHSSSMTITGKNNYYNKFVYEHIRIAEYFINKKESPNELKKACRAWHSKDTSNLVIQHFFSSPKKAWLFIRAGLHHNKQWGIHFLHQSLINILKSLFFNENIES